MDDEFIYQNKYFISKDRKTRQLHGHVRQKQCSLPGSSLTKVMNKQITTLIQIYQIIVSFIRTTHNGKDAKVEEKG